MPTQKVANRAPKPLTVIAIVIVMIKVNVQVQGNIAVRKITNPIETRNA